jgi:hypothetical protein
MKNRAPLLCSLVELYPWGLECDGDDRGSNDQTIKKSDGMGKEGLRKGVFIVETMENAETLIGSESGSGLR